MGALSPRKATELCRPDRSGPRRSARERDRAPRLEAREPLRDERWPPEDPRLRSRQVRDARIRRAWPVHSGYRRRHETRSHRRHDGLHVARAGSRHGRRSQIRHLFVRRDSVRDALRAAGFQARDERRDDGGHHAGRATRAGAVGAEHFSGTRSRRQALPGEGPGASVPVGQRHRVQPLGAVLARGDERPAGRRRADRFGRPVGRGAALHVRRRQRRPRGPGRGTLRGDRNRPFAVSVSLGCRERLGGSPEGRSGDERALAAKLGARYVLEGSIRARGSAIRVSAQLVDAQTGAKLWSENVQPGPPGVERVRGPGRHRGAHRRDGR